ncbi:MAG: CinA family protein [Lachnospiraceae bacterium]|nr:CinA family protein [Lachnospiraceae bacterium]
MEERKIREHYDALVKELIARGCTVSTMESATAGQIASLLTDTPGASAIFFGGRITYCNEEKVKAGVPRELIDTYSVYSKECALAMAEAAKDLYHTDLAIGVTGTMANVDPMNASASTPGRVYLGVVLGERKEAYVLTLPALESRLSYKLAVAEELYEILRKDWM